MKNKTPIVIAAVVAIMLACSLAYIHPWSATPDSTAKQFLDAAIARHDPGRFLAPGVDGGLLTRYPVLRYEIKNVAEDVVSAIVYIPSATGYDEVKLTRKFRVKDGRITEIF
jgi:hypothetical protein